MADSVNPPSADALAPAPSAPLSPARLVWRRVALGVAAVVVPVACFGALDVSRTVDADRARDAQLAVTMQQLQKPLAVPGELKLTREVTTDRLRPNEALSTALMRNGVSAEEVNALVRDLKGALGVRSLRKGALFTLERAPIVAGGEASQLVAFGFKTYSSERVPRTVSAKRIAGELGFDVKAIDANVEVKVEGLTGVVTSSLYNAMLDAGEDGNLVDKFVDVFAWNVDFYRQTQRGDEYHALVEKKYADGAFIGYGKILAAEYVNAGKVFRGYRFQSKDGQLESYFDDEGRPLARTFLKAPVDVVHVTSHYGQRFDPISGEHGSHEGVDYGAPMGTPIYAVGDGVITIARLSSSAGNMVHIKHTNGIETEYFHMSRFAEGTHAGARVTQKQVIGYVGSTGYSTGPHLHFGMYRGGHHVDPSRQDFPTAEPMDKKYGDEFKLFMAPLSAQLAALSRA